MYFGDDLSQLAFIAMVVIAVGGVALALFYPMLSDRSASQRVRAIAESKKGGAQKGGTFAKFMDSQKDSRRKQVQESLKQIEERAKQLQIAAEQKAARDARYAARKARKK